MAGRKYRLTAKGRAYVEPQRLCVCGHRRIVHADCIVDDTWVAHAICMGTNCPCKEFTGTDEFGGHLKGRREPFDLKF